MNIRFFHLAVILLFQHSLSAQKPYFQQEINYKIAATLDDQKHSLTGQVEIEYINHSPDALGEIWMHLWGNAFKSRRSAFCKQKLRDGDGKFYFAPDSALGGFKNLDFTVNGLKADWKYDPENPDIATLRLPQPLPPEGKISIATPFLLKIPVSFSRLGHVGSSYQMTQWFPKPAVYDRKGWHAMPYLDIGEFYADFGTFDVSITLPENYVVGATGVLQTPSETAFLQQKEAETRAALAKGIDGKSDPFPVSATRFKTIRYTAEKVHDFAWFADKRFFVLRDTARLSSGRSVDCWAMFTRSEANLWQKGAFYVRRAIEFYSQHVGEYPWPQATAVHSALSAGGGMEYPMITVINDSGNAKALDEVITHEVGHNWFYGILATNERDHAWMDEGLNSYYERRYMRAYYGSDLSDSMAPKRFYDPSKNGPLTNTGYLIIERDGRNMPPDSPANTFAPIVYGLQSYFKTAMCMEWLEQSAGVDRLDAAMQTYYRTWQFRHPYPEDFSAVLEQSGLPAGWFFQAMQTSKQADYALTKVERRGDGYRLTVKNKGRLAAPFPVTALKNGQPVKTGWFPAAQQTEQITVQVADADAFVIDAEYATLDINRRNNIRRSGGLFPAWEPLQVKLLAPFQQARRSTLGLLPWLGWNNYDKTMLGVLLYNPPLPARRLQYYLAPGFSTGARRFTGLADVRYRLLPGGMAPKLTIGLSAKTFDYDYNAEHDYFAKFYRIAPQVRADLRSRTPSFRHALQFRALFIGAARGQFDSTGFKGVKYQRYTIYETRYEASQRRLPNPYQFSAALEWQNYRDAFDQPASYLRGAATWQQRFYYQPKRKVYLRAFAGYFLKNTQRGRGSVSGDLTRASFALNPQGFNDYRFDQVFLGRTETQGSLSRQVSQTEGGFKAAFGAPYAGVTGNSNNYILALNLKADLPARLPWDIPLKPYFDIGYFDDATPLGEGRPLKEQLLWSGGLALSCLDGNLEIYFPLINAKALKDRYCEASGGGNTSALFCGGNYWKWISWSIRFGRLDPVDLAERMIVN